MHYDLRHPCRECPFRSDIRPYLRPERVDEIARALVRGDFPCHKTTVEVEDDDGFTELRVVADSRHCAGALILLERTKAPSQMMRIVERLGLYDRHGLAMDAPVFQSFEEMKAACESKACGPRG